METGRRSASLGQDARQPRLAMEVDVTADKKTRKRTEGAAATVQAKHGDSCFAKRVQADPMGLTSFGDDFTGHPALPCARNHALADKGAAAPRSCPSPADAHMLTAAGGFLPAGTPTAMRTVFCRPFPSSTLGEETMEKISRKKNNQPAPPCRTKAIQTKSRQTLMFDPWWLNRKSTRLPVCGRAARVAYWMDSFGRYKGSKGLERFW